MYVLNPPKSFPVMVGDMDNTGSLNAQVIHQLTSAVRSKIAIQVRHCEEWNATPGSGSLYIKLTVYSSVHFQ